MNLWQAIREALESLNSNKIRSALTILGIVIGVGAVIAMLAVGSGAQNTITSSISGLGTNMLFVFRGNNAQNIRNPKPLTLGDAAALSDPFQAPSIVAVAPVISSNLTVTYGGNTTNTSVTGVTPEYESVRNVILSEGSFISQQDELGRGLVAVIGQDTAESLFSRKEGLIGESLRISGQPYRIIGVLQPKGGSSFGSQDAIVLVPLSTAQSRLVHRAQSDQVDTIFIQAATSDLVSQASYEASQILRTRHRTQVGLDDFIIYSQQDFVAVASTITGVLTIFLGGIAGISLLVGGIGIMNIMLVSVTERTREIGLRKALGARRRDIMVQFLTESSLLSLFGGIIGIGLGWLIAFIVGRIATATGNAFTPTVTLNAVLLATIFSTAVGLFFGIYPANRAARLEPVEALRYE